MHWRNRAPLMTRSESEKRRMMSQYWLKFWKVFKAVQRYIHNSIKYLRFFWEKNCFCKKLYLDVWQGCECVSAGIYSEWRVCYIWIFFTKWLIVNRILLEKGRIYIVNLLDRDRFSLNSKPHIYEISDNTASIATILLCYWGFDSCILSEADVSL